LTGYFEESLESRPSVRGPTTAFLFSGVKKGSKKTFLYFLLPGLDLPRILSAQDYGLPPANATSLRFTGEEQPKGDGLLRPWEAPSLETKFLRWAKTIFDAATLWILTFQSHMTPPEWIYRLAGLRGKMFEPSGEFFSEPHDGKEFGCVSLVTLLSHYNKVTRSAGPRPRDLGYPAPPSETKTFRKTIQTISGRSPRLRLR
jgi:hypothetical protein